MQGLTCTRLVFDGVLQNAIYLSRVLSMINMGLHIHLNQNNMLVKNNVIIVGKDGDEGYIPSVFYHISHL